MDVINTWEALDAKLEEAAEALKISDDKMRTVFQSFRMDYPEPTSSDPKSQEYFEEQHSLYRRIARKEYDPSNEQSKFFDVEEASKTPFPFYTGSCSTVSSHLILAATLIRLIDLEPGARILEFGPGWGNTTLFLAQMGFDITAYDIEQNFVDLIRRRAERVDARLDVRTGGFFEIEEIEKKFDAIIFFECFHHCSDHLRMIDGLAARIKPGGKVIFGAEPISNDFPVPWGLRLDGESLWAIRTFGWLELGFREDYFLEVMRLHGWSCEKHQALDASFVSFYVATRARFEPLVFHTWSDERICSNYAIRTDDGLLAREGAGYLCFGPYIDLPAGEYLAEIEVYVEAEGWLKIEIASGFDPPITFGVEEKISPTSGTLLVSKNFSISKRTMQVEVRLLGKIDEGTATIKRVSIIEHIENVEG